MMVCWEVRRWGPVLRNWGSGVMGVGVVAISCISCISSISAL